MRSKNNVRKAHNQKLKFISLVSEQHKLREEAIENVLNHPAMADIGPLFAQKQATYRRELEKEKQRLEKEIQSLSKQEFSCENDAKSTGEAWMKKQQKSPYPMACLVQPLTRPIQRRKRGRPKKTDEVKVETIYTLAVHVSPIPEQVIAEHERRLGYFVLETNVEDSCYPLPIFFVNTSSKARWSCGLSFSKIQRSWTPSF